ncbi:PREDICTED: UDP-glucuronosyltransferase 2B4-like isoform X1 [Bactrocera latifrons]|uniref:UDP-glucuronosyltransferase 1-1 n=1 Tax=Bactrocera latifrons TaxID=174628 RepID=A0A0K8WM89_BACLA|nr:PREDICTED: UDP-glucuronosyltransferase 2B4-like isoform X1 [Bactrocera latifrons]
MPMLDNNTPHTAKVFTCAFLLLTACWLPTLISSANILGFFPTFSTTTLFHHCRIAELIARTGHNVTVIGTIENARPRAPYRYIQIELPSEQLGKLRPFEWRNRTAYWDFLKMLSNTLLLSDMALSQPLMKDWIKHAKESDFDLLIFGYFLNDFQMGLASLYKCPIIISITTGPAFWINRLVGNPAEGSYVPSALTPFAQPMNLFDSWFNFWIVLWERTYFSRVLDQENEGYFCLHFNCRNIRMDDVRRNISLVFTNNHFTQGPIRPNVPTMVEIGGIQIPERRIPLPQHIADHINKAEDGVIYINLGKGVNCTDLPRALLDSLHEVLVESQRYVLWRWSHCSKPRQGSKILYTRWMPQNDILAQKKVKLFITHGSMSSLGEGQYHAVPMLGVTYSSELVGNVKFLAQFKLAQRIDAYNTNTNEIRSKLFSMLNDQSYQERAALYSLLYRDRQLTPRETVLYWVNYVLRYRGTPHMRSPAAEMTQLQMLGLDLVIFTFSTIFLIWKFRGFLWRCLTGRMLGNIRKFLRTYLFGNDYEIVIEKYSNIRYDEAVVDAARECQIRPQTVKDPDAPRVVLGKTARQRKFAGRRKR